MVKAILIGAALGAGVTIGLLLLQEFAEAMDEWEERCANQDVL